MNEKNMAAAQARMRPCRPRNLAEAVAGDLQHQAQAGLLRAGDRLPTEVELMRRHGVSRAVVREALTWLQASGVVETRHGVGSFLREAPATQGFHIDLRRLRTLDDMMHVMQLRQSVECMAASLAAMQRGVADMDAMRRALAVRTNAGEDQQDAARLADLGLHLAIARASGNRYFVDFIAYVGRYVMPRVRAALLAPGASVLGDSAPDELAPAGVSAAFVGPGALPSGAHAQAHDEHNAIVQAIDAGDADVASLAMQQHLSNAAHRLRAAYAARADAPAFADIAPS